MAKRKVKPKLVKRRIKAAVPTKTWYCLRVRAGKAKAVKRLIERKRIELNLTEYIGKILIPRKRQLVLKKSAKGSERRVEEKRMRFGRGYLLINVALKTQEVWRLVNSCEFSMGLMPYRYNPSPVSDEEVQSLIDDQKADKVIKVKTGLKPGDWVHILEGMFENMEGQVMSVEGEKTPNPKIKVTMQILGRPVNDTFKHFQIRRTQHGE